MICSCDSEYEPADEYKDDEACPNGQNLGLFMEFSSDYLRNMALGKSSHLCDAVEQYSCLSENTWRAK